MTRLSSPPRTVPFARRILVLGLVCVSVLIGSSTFAGAASSATSAGTFPARLTLTEFAISQAKSVKLIYKFSKPSKSFSYGLSMKMGSSWPTLKSVQQKGNFRGQKTMPVSKIFAGKWIKAGYYRLELSCAGGRNVLNFKIVPFAGQLTKKSFTLSEAGSVKFTYAFSKPSKSFSYQLSVKNGSGWQKLSSYKKIQKKKGLYFRGVRQAALKSLFGKKPLALGNYRLTYACAYSNRALNFSIVTGPGGSGEGTGGSAGADFTIVGGVNGLQPGLAKPIKLTLTNPNGDQIFVTRLTVTISAESTPPGCSSANNIQITQSDASADRPIAVPGNGSVTLTSAPRAPQIEFLDQPWNQDACKNASFILTYTGSAHS
ncbi:MAG: hypothetical protein ABSB96_10830 [Gaiellaceae bacterium]